MIFTEKTYCATFVKNFEIVETIHDNNDKLLETKLGTNYLILLNNFSAIDNLFNKYIDIFIKNRNEIFSDLTIISNLLNNLKDELYETLKNSFISDLIYHDLLNQFNCEYDIYNNSKDFLKKSKLLIKKLKNAIKSNDIDFINNYILAEKLNFHTDEEFKTLYNGPINEKISYVSNAIQDIENKLSKLNENLDDININIVSCFLKILYSILNPLIYLDFNRLTLHNSCDANIIKSILFTGIVFSNLFKDADEFSKFLTTKHCLQIPKSYHDYCVINQDIITFPDVFSYNNSILTNYTLYTLDNIEDFCNASVKHIMDNGLKIIRCENCNKYFIPANRSDEKYCNNISPQNPNKTCKEYGAKKAYMDKVNSNKIKKSHYNTSQFFRMKIKRAKTEKEVNLYTNLFDSYKSTYEKQKKKYNNKKLSEKDFVEWIIAQKSIN